jgi:hypothetical protein
MVLAAEGNRSDGPLDRVCVELNPTVVQEAAEVIPPDQGLADGIRERAARHSMRLSLEPELQGGGLRASQLAAHHTTQLRRPAPDAILHGIKLTDSAQGFVRPASLMLTARSPQGGIIRRGMLARGSS